MRGERGGRADSPERLVCRGSVRVRVCMRVCVTPRAGRDDEWPQHRADGLDFILQAGFSKRVLGRGRAGTASPVPVVGRPVIASGVLRKLQ